MTNSLVNMRKILLVAEETTPGVAPLISTAKPVLAMDSLSVKEMKTTTVDFNTIKGFFGAGEKFVSFFDATVDVEIALSVGGVDGDETNGGVPVPGTVPAWDVLMQSCSFSRSTVAADITGTAQGGNRTTLILAADASAIDNLYTGMPVYVQRANGTSQAPGSTDKNIVKLAAGSSATDDFYTGYYLRYKYFTGTIVDVAGSNSTKRYIYLPLGTVGSGNWTNCELEITTGANSGEVRRIKAYNADTGRAALDSLLAVEPDNTSTFVLSESRQITAYNGTTKVATLASGLKFVSVTGKGYEIAEWRVGGFYDGTSKELMIFPPLSKDPTNSTTYIIGTNVKYVPNSNTGDDQVSCSMWFNLDGQQFQFSYCKGTVVFSVDNNKLPMAKFTFTGILAQYSAESFPANYDFNDWVKPMPINFANTTGINVHGYTDVVLESLSIDVGNTVVHRNRPGADKVMITDRKMKGSVQLERPSVDDFDYLAAIRDAETGVLAVTHGKPRNQLILYCPRSQLVNPDGGDSDGIATVTFETNIMPAGSGGSEFFLTLC